MTGILLAAGLFAAWCAATCSVLERAWPRRRRPVDIRAIAIGCVLLVVNAVITRALTTSAERGTLLRVALAWLVSELLLYAVHRAQHRFAWLWRFHRFHHAPKQLTWAHAWHVHPVDTALFAITASGASWLAGAPLPGAAAFVVLRRAWTVLLHANIRWPASLLDRVLATPSFHHRHHREDSAPVNFAATLALLDVVFGSAAE